MAGFSGSKLVACWRSFCPFRAGCSDALAIGSPIERGFIVEADGCELAFSPAKENVVEFSVILRVDVIHHQNGVHAFPIHCFRIAKSAGKFT